MSYNSVMLSNPGINEDSQLARRQAEGIEDIYFQHTSGDITKGDDHPEEVDLTDEVTRKVDAKTLPLDPIGENESYKAVGGKNYRVRYEDVGGGKQIPYLQEVISRGYYSDTKMALIGGKLYEIEFEKDPATKRISTYLTTSVGDLFQNDKFLQGQNPAQKLELLGKIRKSATFTTWYDSGEYNRYHRKKYDGEENPELDPAKIRSYDLDADAAKLEGALKKQVGTPAKEPVPTELGHVDIAQAATMGTVLGVALYAGRFATKQGTGAAVPKAESNKAVAPSAWQRVRTGRRSSASSFDSPRNRRRFY